MSAVPAARRRAGALSIGATLLALVAGSAASGAPSERAAGDDAAVHVEHTDRNSEQVRKIAIGRKRGQRPQSVISLAPGRVGELRAGDRIEAGGEVQVSVCLKPNLNHSSGRDDCAGKIYPFDPHVDAYLALAPSRRAAKAGQVTPLTSRVKQDCTQKQPNRNHHCTITVPFGGIEVADPSALRCAPDSCRVNLIVSAWHKKARRGNNVIVGGIDGGRIEHKGKGNISIARYRPGTIERPSPLTDTRPSRKRLSVVDEGDDVKPKVVYSVEVPGIRAGEALVIDGLYSASIRRLGYNVRARTQLVFAGSPFSTKDGGRSAAGKIADTSIEIDQQNNFNCTQGRSGHRTPCPIRKVGILRAKNSTNRPFYVNLIAGHGAILDATQRWHQGDAAKLAGQPGYLRVWRYRNQPG